MELFFYLVNTMETVEFVPSELQNVDSESSRQSVPTQIQRTETHERLLTITTSVENQVKASSSFSQRYDKTKSCFPSTGFRKLFIIAATVWMT